MFVDGLSCKHVVMFYNCSHDSRQAGRVEGDVSCSGEVAVARAGRGNEPHAYSYSALNLVQRKCTSR